MKLTVIEGEFSVVKLKDISQVDLSGEFVFVSKTDQELSLVIPTRAAPKTVCAREDGWRAFRVAGTLDFSLVGILSEISSTLAREGIGLFAVSTFDTDYILVKKENLSRALRALNKQAGFQL